MYLMQLETPAQSAEPWDYDSVVQVTLHWPGKACQRKPSTRGPGVAEAVPREPEAARIFAGADREGLPSTPEHGGGSRPRRSTVNHVEG